MNAVPSITARPLLEVLGARWRVGVPAAGVAWDRTTGVAGFALGDGTLALAHPAWDGAPSLRARPGGGAELVSGTAPAPPAARAKAHRAACLSVAADPDGGFLTGGADGRVTRVQADGEVRPIGYYDGAVSLVTAGSGQWRACAIRQTVHRVGIAAGRIDVATPVTALAVDPAGARLAIGHQDGVTLWAGGDAPLVLPAPGVQRGLAWRSSSLGSLNAEGRLRAWRLPDTTMLEVAAQGSAIEAFSEGFLAASGGRIVYWDPPVGALVQCGVPNQASVTRIAGHPHRQLIAAGYANGTVVLCQPDSPALLLLRRAGEGAVTALAFSSSGGCLAIGTDGGEIGVLALPDTLFRDESSRQP